MTTTTIDHNLRKKLNISSVHYLVMDTCAQYKNIWRPTSITEIANVLGLSIRAVSVAVDDLRTSQPPLLEIAENGSFYPTNNWYTSFFEEPIEVKGLDTELAKEVVIMFNEINETKYQLPNNIELVKAIIKQSPRITKEHFKSVIIHKRNTWGIDEKMKEYNRPSTVFRSPKQFHKYLDDANMYWINQTKNDSTTQSPRY